MKYLILTLLAAGVALTGAGCGKLQEGMPQDPVAKCDACHEIPERNEVHVRHLELAEGKYNCDACHKAYDTLTGWNMDNSWHRNGMIDTVPGECDYCHDYFWDCEECHYTPPHDSMWDNPIEVKIHKVHGAQDKDNCDQCHKGFGLEPKRVVRAIHDNGNRDLIFNTYVAPGGPQPYSEEIEDPTSGEVVNVICYNLYCHGASIVGGKQSVSANDSKPQDSTQCSFCHDLATLRATTNHQRVPSDQESNFLACFNCHADKFSAAVFTVDEDLHIDGQITVNREQMDQLFPLVP
jgi:hypothetical protein